jgi:hypothetical protein
MDPPDETTPLSATATTPSCPPSVATAVIVLGDAMFFRPTGEEDDGIVSATVTEKEQLSTCLAHVAVGTLHTVHVIVKAASLDGLYDPEAMRAHIAPLLRPNGIVVFHALEHAADEEHVEAIALSLVLAGLRIELVEDGAAGGAKIVTARKVPLE